MSTPRPARITGLEPDPYRSGAVRLMVNGKLYCTVPAESVGIERWEVGVELTEQVRERANAAADSEAAYRGALRALARRPLARADLGRRLMRRGHPPDAVEAALGRAQAAGLLDDAVFAVHYTQTRANRGLGPDRIRRDLGRMGISESVISSALAGQWPPDVDPKHQARMLANKRAVQLAGLPRETRLRRLLGYLARRGFSGRQAKEIVREVLG